jgi:hypothetical protein
VLAKHNHSLYGKFLSEFSKNVMMGFVLASDEFGWHFHI